MQDLVQNKFSIHMHPEWKTLGKFTNGDLSAWK
jgi:hypothetical protein